MSEVKHTPGPWRVLDTPAPSPIYNALICMLKSSDDGQIAVTTVGGRMSHSSEWQSNAHLIAAAPELLEVAKKCLEIVEWGRLPNWDWMREVIAKAEGRTP